MNSLAGQLLIAAPEMSDDYFANSVVLVFQHSDEGAAGVVLNKPSDVRVDAVWSELNDPQSPPAEDVINIGGPCEGPIIAIHNSLAFAEVSVIPGVALTVGIDNLRKLMRQTQQTVRLFSGYSGWSPLQLESEIHRGGWYSIPARPKFIFGESVDMWRNACGQFGDQIIKGVAGQNVPSDPTMN